MSMISEQVNKLRHSADIFDTVGSAWELNRAEAKKLQKMLREAASTIESLSAKLQAENVERSVEDFGCWILCEERLPEDETWVLTTHKPGLNPCKQIIVHYFKNGEFLYNWDMDNDFNSPTFGQRYMGDVIAWMPYPTIFSDFG